MREGVMRSLLATFLLALLGVLAFAAPSPALETGVNETLGQTRPTAQSAAELGAGWVRLWSSWEAAQPAPNAWAPDVLASMNNSVAEAKARGLKVLMVVQ